MNGDVVLRVEGLMLERLIQRAVSENARFRRISRDGPRAMRFETDPQSAEILRKLCERFSLSFQEIERRGQDAMLRRLRRRGTLLAGMLTGLFVFTMFFSRVWMIDIEAAGGRAFDAAPVRAALSSLGVRPGMSRKAVDAGLLADALSASAPEFSFVGVRLQGVRLLVEVSSSVPPPELYAVDHGRDLIALRDGVVESVNVLSGAACVQPGDTVLRGQVLIRGDERITKEETRSVAALGSVIARTWHEGAASLPLKKTETIRTGRTGTSSEIRLLNLSWPLSQGETFAAQETQTELLPIGGLFLPLQIQRTTAFETHEHTVAADPEALKRALAPLAFAQAAAKLAQSHPDGCEIADRWIEYTYDADRITARAVYETHTDIAATRDALYRQGG